MVQILTDFNWISVVFRLFLAAVLGGLIGLEREKITRSAGFRTCTLVCLGATLAMLVGDYIRSNLGSTYEVARIGAQVISGIGFLGAGAILSSGTRKVIGLTTAAALWICACIGLAIGVGFYLGAVVACLFALIILRVMKAVDRRAWRNERLIDLYLELSQANAVSQVEDFFEDRQIQITFLKSCAPKVKGNQLGLNITIMVKQNKLSQDWLNEMGQLESVSMVHRQYL